MPTTYYLFHQNMRVYGGGSVDRNDAFRQAFSEISDDIGHTSRILVAGFTEVMNSKVCAKELPGLALKLDPALKTTYFLACGITALTRTLVPEYVAISTYSTFKVGIMGRVLKKADKSWGCWSSDDGPVGELPSGLAADVRGLGYVGGTHNGKSLIVGYMHNMYNLGERSTYFQSLPKMMQLIKAKHPDWDKVPIVFGGDFNLPPRAISRRSETYTICARDASDEPINTTSKHAYDYWISDRDIAAESAEVFEQTRDVGEGISDHAGIGLDVTDMV